MENPGIWHMLSALFLVAGALNVRPRRTQDAGHRAVRVRLALACVFWSLTAQGCRLRFTELWSASAAMAAAIMLWAAWHGIRPTK